MKKFISILLSVVMVLSLIPFTTLTAYAAPSTVKKDTSVVAVTNDILKYANKIYYFDSLQEAFDYLPSQQTYTVATLLKDITLDEPAVLTDEEDNWDINTYYLELNDHFIYAPNGNAIELMDMWCNFFVDGYKQAYDDNDGIPYNGIDGCGGIYAKDYAIFGNDFSVVLSGGTYSSETKEFPVIVNDPYNCGGICNIRQTAIVKTENTVYNGDGTFGNAGNVYLRYIDNNGTKDHFAYFHILENQVNGQDMYIVEKHNYSYVTESIASDRQSADVSYKCTCGLTKSNVAAEALIGDTAYVRVSQAISAVENGETATIEILKNCSITSIYVDNGKDITFELNGHTLTQNSGYIIPTGGHLTMQNGIINSASNNVFVLKGTNDSTATNYTNLNLDNMVINNTYPESGTIVFIENPLTNWSNPNNCYGINVTVNNSKFTADGPGLSINGNYANISNPTHIDITDTEIASKEQLAMFISGYAEINSIASKFTGCISGAEIRAGVFNILGDDNEFTSTYDGMTEVESNKSGTTTMGAGLAVAQHNLQPNPNPVKVNIYGGTFNGSTAIIEKQVQNVPVSQQDVTIKIFDGEFNGTDDAVIVDSCTGFISGGEYSVDPDPTYIEDGKGTRLDENDMYVLTDLDYYAYRAAVKTAKAIDRNLYTADSLAALDSAIVSESSLATQSEIDSATSLVQTKYAELVYKYFNVRFVIETADGTQTTTDTAYQYNDEVTLDVSYIDEDVYKWTVEQDNNTKKLPTDAKIVTMVVKGETTVTVYTAANTNPSEELTKVTFLSNKDKAIGIEYVENVNDATPPEAPTVPFYDFAGWEKVDDTTFKATYTYNSGYCKFVGGMNVVVENGGNVSTNNDTGIDVPYDDVVKVSSSVEGQLALSADKEGTKILTYINDVATIHAPKRESVWVIVLPKVDDATVGITGGYVKFVDSEKKKVAINGQYYLPDGCTMVDTGAVLSNKHNDFKIGDNGAIRLVSTMQSSSNEFTVALTTKYGSMENIYARTYLTYTTSSGETKTIYSNVKAVSLTTQGNIE